MALGSFLVFFFIIIINADLTPLNCDDGSLLPDTYLHLVREKGS